MVRSLSADELRSTFLDFHVEKKHTLVPSMPLVPNHPAAPLFTNAGMVQFLSYFFAEEKPPFPRATSSQKCLRVRGKHDDIENVGRTTRHLTFFEMLGNFSFGDYFKQGAIELAWEFLTERLEFDAERLWATVHDDDDEAAEMWRDLVGMPAERIQRTGEDNFWEMGPTGPCGPSSELFYDRGEELGPPGGPVHGGEERFVEIWNLVFMSFNRLEDGSLVPLAKRNIDTGAGLERILPIVQGVTSVFDSNVLRGLIGTAEEITGTVYGRDEEMDVSLRIVADHARAITFLVGDGVVPSNEERGYVLRRIIRRAVRHGMRAGVRGDLLPRMAAAVAEAMKAGYPELSRDLDAISATLEREEHRFVHTLQTGMQLLEGAIGDGDEELPGEVAFKLHDTHGLPIELTSEIAAERGLSVDVEGYERAMEQQRQQARWADGGHSPSDGAGAARAVLNDNPPVEFLGYEQLEAEGRILAVDRTEDGHLQVFTDRTPFYAQAGGQIGDTGTIRTERGMARVVDTDSPLLGVTRHLAELEEGEIAAGEEALLTVDRRRREALRRSHTATHLLHWALRSTLGPQVRQQGSLVAPDQLRFDFNHHAPLGEEELNRIEELVIGEIVGDGPVVTETMAMAEAKQTGAMSFFGDKYGDVVRVVRAGEHSIELCGGTHVSSLGRIGQFSIRGDASVGANLRRIEALTGFGAHDAYVADRRLLRQAALELKVPDEELLEGVRKLKQREQDRERERRRLISQLNGHVATALLQSAAGGIVVARCDGRDQQAMRELIERVHGKPNIVAVGLVGTPDGKNVVIGAASSDESVDARDLVREAAGIVGGGGGGRNPRLALGGGRDASRIDEAVEALRRALSPLGAGASSD
jgi:alanyl-tRNA synthetase